MELDTKKAGRSPSIAVAVLAMALPFAGALWASPSAAQDFSSSQDMVHVDLYRQGVRFGLSGVGGGFVGVVHGGVAGLAPRVGVQLDDMIGMYLQVHGLVGNYDSETTGGRVAGFLFNEIMIDVTFLNRFQVAVGPSLDFTWNCAEANHVDPCGNGEARFGGDLRLGLVLGDGAEGRVGERNGVVLSLEVHPTWLDPDFNVMMLFGLGGEIY